MKKLLGTEVIGDRTERTWLHTGPDGKDRLTVESTQDVEPLINLNKRAYNDAPKRFGEGLMHKVADIPVTVIEDICRIEKIGFQELMQNKTDRAQGCWNKLLNAPEFRAFRTRPGRVDMRPKG